MDGIGRPEKLTDELKKWIVTNQRGRKKKLKATAIRNDMRTFLETELRKQNKERELPWSETLLRSEIDNQMPGLSAIQKYLKPVNERLGKPNPLDNPWQLGLMAKPEYTIPPEAGSNIADIQEYIEKTPLDGLEMERTPLSIREALWVARLYTFKRNIKFLYQWVKTYAEFERLCQLSETPLDTSILDKGIRQVSWPVVGFNDEYGNPVIDVFNSDDSSIESIVLTKKE